MTSSSSWLNRVCNAVVLPRSNYQFGLFETVAFIAYTALASVIAYFHEPWADEAQAWLVARDSGFFQMLFHQLHYEGTPPLWHILLWMLAHLHLPYGSMHVLSVLLGAAAVYVWLRHAPVPALLRFLVPFTFPLVYQTAVVARSYSMAPLLVFLLCTAFTSRRLRLMQVALLAGLLAATSIPAMVLAFGILVAYGWYVQTQHPDIQTLAWKLPFTLAAALFVFSFYCALPASDISYSQAGKVSGHSSILAKLTGTHRPDISTPLDTDARLKAPPLDMAISLPHRLLAVKHTPAEFLVRHILTSLSLLAYATSSSLLAALAFTALLVYTLYRGRQLYYLIPAALLIFMGAFFFNLGPRHTSLVFLSLLLPLWWMRANSQPAVSSSLAGRSALLLVVASLILLEQVGWMAFAAHYDIHNDYDPGQALASYMASQPPNLKTDVISFFAVAAEPYFAASPFANHATGYWPWQVGKDPGLPLRFVVQQQPDRIIDDDRISGNVILENQVMWVLPEQRAFDQRDKESYLASYGYHPSTRFCGKEPAHFGFLCSFCVTVYQK